MHLTERAVHPRGFALRTGNARRLRAYEDAPAVLPQKREFVHLPARRVHRRHQAALYVVRVLRPRRPSRETGPPDRLVGGPPEDPLGLAVPVGDHPVRVEGAERRVHAVEKRGEKIVGPGPWLVGTERVGGLANPGSTHLAPPAGVRLCCTAEPGIIQLERDAAHTWFGEKMLPP
ncbi:hypothetical protein GCM10010353_54430 [Streptomyces chryseus]|nr:hypothetical protein GCM10010353_54430 [Streptomyces chryseus]